MLHISFLILMITCIINNKESVLSQSHGCTRAVCPSQRYYEIDIPKLYWSVI